MSIFVLIYLKPHQSERRIQNHIHVKIWIRTNVIQMKHCRRGSPWSSGGSHNSYRGLPLNSGALRWSSGSSVYLDLDPLKNKNP
jgi:hypothetical protein